jgi:hypothetical protein
MGHSPKATIAWGVDLGDVNACDIHDSIADLNISEALGNTELDSICGFTVPRPRREDYPGLEEWRPAYDTWLGTREIKVPVSLKSYGYEYGGHALVITRTVFSVEWACQEIPWVFRITGPYAPEIKALNKVLNSIGFAGNGFIKHLLMASYG